MGIGDMRVDRVGRVDDRGNAALRPAGSRVGECLFGDQRNAVRIGQAQCQRLAGQAAADNQDVKTAGCVFFHEGEYSIAGMRWNYLPTRLSITQSVTDWRQGRLGMLGILARSQNDGGKFIRRE